MLARNSSTENREQKQSAGCYIVKTNLVVYTESLEDNLRQHYTETCFALHLFCRLFGFPGTAILGILLCSNDKCLHNAQHSRFTQCVVKDLHISSSVKQLTQLYRRKTWQVMNCTQNFFNNLNGPPRKSCFACF